MRVQAWANLHEQRRPITGLEMCDTQFTHRPIVEVPQHFVLWDLKMNRYRSIYNLSAKNGLEVYLGKEKISALNFVTKGVRKGFSRGPGHKDPNPNWVNTKEYLINVIAICYWPRIT